MPVPASSLLLALALCFSSAAAAEPPCPTGGQVVDSTGAPLPGVTVSLGGTVRAVTDGDGRYCVAAREDERGDLVFELPGFRTGRRAAGSTQPGGAIVLEPTHTENVVVTATRTSKGLDGVPVRTEVVRRDLITALGARSLADAVEYTNGVRVENNCQNCNFSQIRLLGLEGPYTQILIDGLPVVSSLAQVYAIEQIPARLVERIEVVKGGGSALYGAGSVGGVVNLIPREPTRRGGSFDTELRSTGGELNLLMGGSADWVSANRAASLTVFGQADRAAAIDVNGDGFSEQSRRQLDAAGARYTHHLAGGRARFTTDVFRFHEDRRGGDLLHLAPHEASVTEWAEAARHAAAATWFHIPDPRLDYRVMVSLADTRRDTYYGSGGDPNAYGETANQLWVLDAQTNHYASNQIVSWGGQAMFESLEDQQPAYHRSIRDAYRSTGLFVQHDWALRPGVQMLNGVRADRHSALDRTILSPRAALMLSPKPSLDFRLSAARGFRAPQVFDEDLHIAQVGGEAVVIRHDPALREERSTNWMAGMEWKPEAGAGQALLEANVFYTRLTDLFFNAEHPAPLSGARELLKVNLGGARVYGVELNAGWGIGDRLILQGGVVLQRARFDEAEPDFGSTSFHRTPERYGVFTAIYDTGARGRAFAGLRYTGAMQAPHYAGYIAHDVLERTPSFVVVDATYDYPIPVADGRRIVVGVVGRNLTNAYQADLDRGPDRDSGYVYGPRFPRSVSVRLRVEF